MKRHYLFLLLSFSIFTLKAQYAPIGATWYFGLPDGNGFDREGSLKYKTIKDTVINSEVYSVIVGYNDDGRPTENLYYYLGQKNDTVFYFYKHQKKILFNLNVNIGDITELDLLKYDLKTYKTKVRIDTIEWRKDNSLNNDSLKRYIFTALNGQTIKGSGEFTEKIIYPISTGMLIAILFWPSIPEGIPYLRCYTDSNYEYKTKYFTKACDFDNVGIENPANKKQITIYPNPANDRLFVNMSNKPVIENELIIYNCNGQLINRFIIEPSQTLTINVENFPTGLYLLKIFNNSNGTNETVKVMIIH